MLRSLGPATALALVLVLVTGCSDDDASGESPPSTSPSSSESPPAPTDSSSSDTGTPSPSPSPSIEPASGPEVRVERFSVRAPRGWKIAPEEDPFTGQAVDGFASIFVGEQPDFGQGQLTLEESARSRLRTAAYSRRPKILDPVTFNGQEWFHIAGQTNETDFSEDFGTVIDGLDLGVYMSFPVDTPAAERRAIAESVMATATLD